MMHGYTKFARPLTALVAALALTLAACGDSGETENNDGGGETLVNPFAGDAAEADAGKVLYDNDNCSGCHGMDGKSETFLDLSTVTTAPEGRLFTSIKDGIEGTAMTGYAAKHSDEDIWRMVTWVQSIQ